MCRANNVQLTAVIFPNRSNAINTKMQDWKSWSINNFVDGFTPLFLTCDDKTATNLMEEVLRNKSASTKLYAGIFVTFMNGSNSDLMKQIHAARKLSLNGLIFFDYAHLNDSYIEALTENTFKAPHKEVMVKEEYKQNSQSKPELKKEKKKRANKWGNRKGK